MAVTVTRLNGSPKTWDTSVSHLAFTSTTATAEVACDLSKIYAYSVCRVGNAAGDNTGLLTLDETANSDGSVDVPAGGNVTIDRTAVTASGTLASEEFVIIFYGQS